MPTWQLAHYTSWAAQARQDIAVGGTFDSAFWTDIAPTTGAWRCEEGGVVFIPVASGGNYSVAPSVVMPAANGYATARVNATATVVMTGTAITGVNITNIGKGYVSCAAPTLSGGTGSGGMLGVPTLQGRTLQEQFAGTSGGFGSGQHLINPAGNSTLNQRIVIRFIMTASTDKVALTLRYASATDEKFAANFTGTVTQLWYFKGYNGTIGTATNLGTTGTTVAPLVGHVVELEFFAVSTSPTTTDLTINVRNITLGTLMGTFTKTAQVQAGVQASGQVGFGFTQSSSTSVTEVWTYNDVGMLASIPNTAVAGTTVTFSLTGLLTHWLSLAPPLLTAPIPYTIITPVTALTETTATVTIRFGGNSGTFTFIDPETGTFYTIPVTGINVPNLTISDVGVGTAKVNFAAGATSGSPPYTVRVYGSAWSAQVPGVGDSILLSTQVGVGSGVVPTSFVETAIARGVRFWKATFTDTLGVTAQTPQIQAVIPYAYAKKKIMGIGDSVMLGASATNYVDRVVGIVITAGGTGYNSEPVITISGGNVVRNAVSGGTIIVGGVIKAIWLYDAGLYLDTTSPTVTITGGGGTGATATATIGGGQMMALEEMLRNVYGMSSRHICENTGVSGTHAADWMGNGITAGGKTDSSYNLDKSILQAGPPSVTSAFWYRIGLNDADTRVQTSAANYKLQVRATATKLIGLGYKLILDKPTLRMIPNGNNVDENSLLLLQQYCVVIDELIAEFAISNPGYVIDPGMDNFAAFVDDNRLLSTDVLHPKDVGYGILAGSSFFTAAQAMELDTSVIITRASASTEGTAFTPITKYN